VGPKVKQGARYENGNARTRIYYRRGYNIGEHGDVEVYTRIRIRGCIDSSEVTRGWNAEGRRPRRTASAKGFVAPELARSLSRFPEYIAEHRGRANTWTESGSAEGSEVAWTARGMFGDDS